MSDHGPIPFSPSLAHAPHPQMQHVVLTLQVWITQGDIILLSLRDFQDDKADVIHRYTPDEARSLKTYGELKSDFQINEGGEGGESTAVRLLYFLLTGPRRRRLRRGGRCRVRGGRD